MKKLEISQMENLQGEGWGKCALGVSGGALLGAAGACVAGAGAGFDSEAGNSASG
jgi:hypothetical protein